jgi:predicted nuclease of restriction endonuclease-like (RecB) superfamily
MNFEQLIETISQTHDYLQQKAISSVNQSLTIRNWLFGYYLVEYEQSGEDRAQYGGQILKKIASSLKPVKGFSVTNLKLYRQLYITYPSIGQTLSDQLVSEEIVRTLKKLEVSKKEELGVKPLLLISRLSYSHLVELMKEEESLKRAFYEMQTIKGNWSVRELERQRGSLLYERTGLSNNKEKLLAITQEEAVQLLPADIIRDPYVFEFVGLKQYEVLKEEKLEEALLNHIQQFLLELGKGFCFESRQKRITVDNEHHYVDLVFYHRQLKCHIIIELKTRKFNHGDAGQMNFYLNYFKENEMETGDNPPIGILLCTEKGVSTAKYATAGMDNQFFVSKYKTVLPTEEDLQKEIEKEKRMLEE